MPYSTSQVLQMIQHPSNDYGKEDSWDEFVSYDQHPMTGEPTFFLHPCQTAQRLSLLLQQPKEQESPLVVSPLLSWLVMIVPAIGFRIMPTTKTFCQVQEWMIRAAEDINVNKRHNVQVSEAEYYCHGNIT